MLSAVMLLGFNLVATAPTLEHSFKGWVLLGFASTFLIGTYNERPTVLDNATFVFFIYQLSESGLLVATQFESTDSKLVASGLLLSALLKSSQFPFTNMFSRSME